MSCFFCSCRKSRSRKKSVTFDEVNIVVGEEIHFGEKLEDIGDDIVTNINADPLENRRRASVDSAKFERVIRNHISPDLSPDENEEEFFETKSTISATKNEERTSI